MKKIMVSATIALICLLFVACPLEWELLPTVDNPWVHMVVNDVTGATEYQPISYGPVTGEARGYQSTVRVTVTLTNGAISVVEIDVSGDTQSIVRRVPDVLPTHVHRSNSFDFSPQVVSGATITVAGVLRAGRNALRQVPGIVGVPEN